MAFRARKVFGSFEKRTPGVARDLEVQGSSPPTCHWQDLFLGSPEFKSSRFVNSQLVCLLPFGIFNHVTLI